MDTHDSYGFRLWHHFPLGHGSWGKLALLHSISGLPRSGISGCMIT